jgi:hypothetical protein
VEEQPLLSRVGGDVFEKTLTQSLPYLAVISGPRLGILFSVHVPSFEYECRSTGVLTKGVLISPGALRDEYIPRSFAQLTTAGGRLRDGDLGTELLKAGIFIVVILFLLDLIDSRTVNVTASGAYTLIYRSDIQVACEYAVLVLYSHSYPVDMAGCETEIVPLYGEVIGEETYSVLVRMYN